MCYAGVETEVLWPVGAQADTSREEYVYEPDTTQYPGDLYCIVCDVPCSSKETYRSHVEGRKHRNAVTQAAHLQRVRQLTQQDIETMKIPKRSDTKKSDTPRLEDAGVTGVLQSKSSSCIAFSTLSHWESMIFQSPQHADMLLICDRRYVRKILTCTNDECIPYGIACPK